MSPRTFGAALLAAASLLTFAPAAAPAAAESNDVTDLGAVLTGQALGRRDSNATTLFDSTGLAIQDLAVAAAALEALRDGRVQGQTATL